MTSIKKNFLYSSILTTAGYLFPLITYPYISRVLGVTNIGAVNFVDSIINYFVLFSMLGISVSGIREIASCGSNRIKRSEVFSSLLSLNIISTLLMLTILITCIYLVQELKPYRELLWIGALKLVFNLFLIEWLYKGLEAFRFITRRTLIVRTLYVISIFIFVRTVEDRNIYYLLTSVSIVVNAIINMLYSRNYVNFRFTSVKIRKFWRSFVGIGVYMILTSMYGGFNITYLGFIAGDTQVGYYTTATKIYAILLAIFTAFTGVMLPRMSSLLSEGKLDEFRNKIKISYSALSMFAIPVIAFGIILAPQIILLISGTGYEGAIIPMRITLPLILIVGINQILVIQTQMPLKMDKQIVRISAVGATVGVTLNFVIVPHLYSIGSAIVWVCCEFLILCLSQITVWNTVKIGLPLKSIFTNIIIYIPLAVIVWFESNIWISHYVMALIIAGITTLFYMIIVNVYITKNQLAMMLWSRVVAVVNSITSR